MKNSANHAEHLPSLLGEDPILPFYLNQYWHLSPCQQLRGRQEYHCVMSSDHQACAHQLQYIKEGEWNKSAVDTWNYGDVDQLAISRVVGTWTS